MSSYADISKMKPVFQKARKKLLLSNDKKDKKVENLKRCSKCKTYYYNVKNNPCGDLKFTLYKNCCYFKI